MRWDEHLHPRDPHGKFSHGHGVLTGAKTGIIAKRARPTAIDRAGRVAVTSTGSARMSDAQFTARRQRVEQVIAAARPHYSTEVTETTPSGRWKPERARIHRQIADDMYAKAAHVPNDGQAVIAGGLGGAGKTTVLSDHAGIDTTKYLTINPDDIKEEMARRGLVPQVPGAPDLSPMERAALIHAESGTIADLIANRAYRDRKNVIWDITMSTVPGTTAIVNQMHRRGYRIQGVFVDIPVEVAVTRAMRRYRQGVDDYHNGQGLGGRFVPPSVIRAQRTSSGRTVNRQAFTRIRDTFDSWAMYDNSVDGRPPVLIGKSRGGT